jgi:Protein of unknown function (DUF1232)
VDKWYDLYMKKALAVMIMIVCVLYVLNPTAGVFELLPDNLPIIGNIDEALAVYLSRQSHCIKAARSKSPSKHLSLRLQRGQRLPYRDHSAVYFNITYNQHYFI